MRVQFFGAAGEVTGSCHLVTAGEQRILLDCGFVQSGRDEARRNAAPFAFDVDAIDAMVLSHAHIDHVGRLPLLIKRGYRGPIYTQEATADLSKVMLEDSASLAAQDAEAENRRRARRGLQAIEPLYNTHDVAAVLKLFRPLPYATQREILPGIRIALQDAGHIIGAAIVELWADQGGASRKLVFSGDIGPKGTPILRDPTPIAEADLVLLESTYGDRLHRSRSDTIAELGEIFRAAWDSGGNVLIPAFAVGRTQEILYWFAKHFDAWGLGRWKIFLDSPMAAKVLKVYERHTHLFDAEAQAVWKGARNPFKLPNLKLTVSPQESQALNQIGGGAIIIAGSGMCNGGRIRHHLRHNLWRKNAHVIFPGFQAMGTLGRELVDGAKFVRIFGEAVRVLATRHTVGGLSAHADQAGLLQWYGHFRSRPPVYLVHGEDPAREVLAGKLRQDFRAVVHLTRPGSDAEV